MAEKVGFLQTKDYISFKVVTADGEVIGAFQDAAAADKALPGDCVSWNPETRRCKLESRAKVWPLVGTVELASKTKYGITSRGSPMYLFVPSNRAYPCMIVGCSERDVSRNRIGIVDFESWTTTAFPRGNLRRLLGVCGDPAIEREALLLTYNPFPVPKPTAATNELPLLNLNGRMQCPPMTFNIDPVGCKDIDDVLSFEPLGDGWRLWITIADVTETITEGSTLDLVASLQSLTAYENGKAVRPMLPHAYSEDACSLIPGVERAGVSLILDIYGKEIRAQKWCLTRLVNECQYDYDTFVDRAKVAGIPVRALADFAEGILGRATADPHEWIEACMLKYNMEAAAMLRGAGQGVLRKHDMPDYEQLAKYTLLGGADLAVLANRSAVYCPANDPDPLHWGLKAKAYCHASSPIRRYADLINQRILKTIIRGVPNSCLPINYSWLNQRQTDLKRYERDLFFLDQIKLGAKGSIKATVLERSLVGDKGIARGAPLMKLKLWVPEWKRVVTWKTATPLIDAVAAGVEINLSYFANAAVRFWKEKLVFRFEGIA